MKSSIIVGPISAYLSNRNSLLNLPLHSHYCEVTMGFSAEGDLGFPVMDDAIECLTREIREFLQQEFDGETNEKISARLFQHLSQWDLPPNLVRSGKYKLLWLEIAVHCVKDRLGHADMVTRYLTEA